MRITEEPNRVTVVFPRQEMPMCDYSAFLAAFAMERLPGGPTLAAMMGTMDFEIYGYESDPRELYQIPEVRRFYAGLDHAWPYWAYFCNLKSETFMVMLLCCLQSSEGVPIVDHGRAGVTYDPNELIKWLQRRFGHMNILCERAGMSEKLIMRRTNQLFQYFKLPVAAER